MDDINIGEKILEYRKGKSMSIKDLSLASGVTSSMLSQIERGLANPSINSLKSIAKALEVPIFNFFMSQVDTDSLVVRSDQRKKMIFPENEDFAYELLSPNTSGKMGMMLMTLSSGTSSSEKLMDHPGEEEAVVTSGRVDLHLSDKVITLNEGDSVRILSNMGHRWCNPYSDDAKVVFAISPPLF